MKNSSFANYLTVTLYIMLAAFCSSQTGADVLTISNEAQAKEVTQLSFCYEDKQLLPYYTGNDQAVPTFPGATIEHLQHATRQLNIELTLVRQPWLRCLQQLEEGTIDALVASYDEERAYYTVYPQLAKGVPDSNLSINQMSLCLAFRFDNPLLKQTHATDSPFTLARPLGYKPIPFPDTTILVAAHSIEQALELVIEGRVDATTVLCQLNGVDAKENQLNLTPLTLIYPPLHEAYGYLMFSRRFYSLYPEQAQALWQTLPLHLNKNRYIDYLRYAQW